MEKAKIAFTACLIMISFAACSNVQNSNNQSEEPMNSGVAEIIDSTENAYTQISQDEAYQLMNSGNNIIILDVRSKEEFDEGHISKAINFDVDTITEESAKQILPDNKQTILVYCRSGRRSKIAAESLAEYGYTDVREFGGIDTWPYDIVKDDNEDSFSNTTLIISVDSDFADEDMDSLCAKYKLEVIYDYENFNMYAVKTKTELSADSFEKLIVALSEEDGILQVEKDGVMTLDEEEIDQHE